MARNDAFRTMVDLALENGGALSVKLLEDRGLSRRSLARRVAGGDLIPVVKGTYVVRALESPTSTAWAMQLRYPTGALCRFSAAEIHGFRLDEPPIPQWLLPHGASVQVPGLRIHETRHLPEADVRTIDGLRITSPARTICDIAPGLTNKRLVHLLETQLAARAPSDAALVACLSERLRRGVSGMEDLAEVVASMLDEQAYPESALEVMLARSLQQGGVEGLQRQFRPEWYDGLRGVVDFADPVGKTIIEADGRGFRKVTQAHDNDRQRDRTAASHGYLVLRIGYRELEQRTGSVIEEIAAVLEARRSGSTGLSVAA